MKAPLLTLVLGLTLAHAACGQEAPSRRVRLALRDGAVVEGRLEAFADRTYRVQLADGRTREVHERDVTRVDFDAADALPSTPTATLAEVVRRAIASGALAQRIGVPVHLACADHKLPRPGAPPVESEYLLRLVTTVDPSAGTLALEAETRLRSARALDPRLLPDLNPHGPARYRWTIGLADGRLRRLEAWSDRVDLDGRFGEGRVHWAKRKEDRFREQDEAFPAEAVPLELMAFVLAPLHDQGLPASLVAFAGTRRELVVRLRALPAVGAERTIELADERDGEPTGDVTRVVVGPSGLVRLEAVRVEAVRAGREDGVRVTKETTTAERLTAEAYEARVRAWGAVPAPAGPRTVVAAEAAPDPVAALLVAARADGSLARLEGERWFAALGDRGGVTLTRVVGRREGEELTLEVHQERPGDPAATRLEACTWDGAGRLRRVVLREVADGVAGEAVGHVDSSRLVVAVRSTAPGVALPVGELSVTLPPGAVPVTAARFGLAALGALVPARLDVTGVALELQSVRLHDQALERTARGVRLASRSGVDTDPLWLSTTAADGALVSVGLDPDGLRDEFAAPLEVDKHAAHAVSAAEFAALREDPSVMAAGRALARREAETVMVRALEQVHRAQETFRATDADRDGEPDFAADLDELRRAGLLKGTLSGGQPHGYRVVVGRAQDAPEERWLAVADPVDPDAPSLAITHEGKVLAGPGPFAPVGADALVPAAAKEAR